MTSGLDNLSLALFTALAPAGVVAFIVLALARIFSADHDRAVRIDRMIALPFAVALLGFIASATHLGTPANALQGYGVSKKGIDFAHQTGVKLIIILDCGIKAIQEIEYAKSLLLPQTET